MRAMLNMNLATRPLYNERLVQGGLLAAAALVAGLTLFNATRIVSVSREARALEAEAAQTEERARTLEQEAASTQRAVSGTELVGLEHAAREANAIIDRRIFSWTEFFNLIETNLPPGVMVTSVRPNIASDGIRITLAAVGRRVEDLDAFMEQLEATGAFSGLLSRQEEVTDAGTYRAVLEGWYDPNAPRPGEVAETSAE